MKVILSAKSVYPFHPVGGVQKYVYYYAKALALKGVDIEIVAPWHKRGSSTETYDGLNYTFLRPSIQKYLEYPIGWLGVHMFSYSLARYLKNQNFDILHAFDLTSYQYLRQSPRKPVIAHVFTDNYLSNPIDIQSSLNLTGSRFDKIKEEKVRITPFSNNAIKRKYFLQYLFKIKPIYACLKRCERIFLEAELFEKEVNKLFQLKEAKTDIIPVGVDIDMIENKLKSISVSREDIGFSPEDIVLITVNRLAADKGIDKIVFAMERLVKENPKFKLIIIGSGYQERELYNLIEQKDLWKYVRHFKNVTEDQLYQYYRISDIYISALSYPGSSISTLEAMACSLPIMTTAQPWLIENGKNGIGLGNNSPDTIKTAVLDLVKQNQLKAQGQVSNDIAHQFDWGMIADKALIQYEHMLGKRVAHV